MMTASRSRVLPLAFGLAAATTFLTYLFLTRQGALRLRLPAVARAAAMTTVLVPSADLAPMQPLRPAMFVPRALPTASVTREDVVVPAELTNKVALAALPAGQPVPRTALAARGPQLGMAFTVHAPRHAVTVALDQVIGVAGFPKPGNHVDVLVSVNVRENTWMTYTVLQDVEILAMGADLQPAAPQPGKPAQASANAEVKLQPTATLAVLPDEAERLVLAQVSGKLQLALRPVGDISRPKLPPVSSTQFMSDAGKPAGPVKPASHPRPAAAVAHQKAPAPARKPAPVVPPHVVVVRGSQSEVVQVPRAGTDRHAGPAAALAPVVAPVSPAPVAVPARSDPKPAVPGATPAAATALASVTAPAPSAPEGGNR